MRTSSGAPRADWPRWRANPDPVSIGGEDGDLAASVAARVGGLGGVLHQVQEDLDQLVLVALHRRQRGVVLLAHGEAVATPLAASARTRSSTSWMFTVAKAGLHVLGELLHAVDQPGHAVGLVDDQLRQRLVLALAPPLSNWAAPRMPARGSDLVGQHAPEPHDRAQSGHVGSALDAQPGLDRQRQQHEPSPSGARGPVGLEGRQAEQA